MEAFTLKERVETGEFHLFKGQMTNNTCTSNYYSICNKMNINQCRRNVFQCLDEDNARKRCAVIGRAVCGICVSHLYESY